MMEYLYGPILPSIARLYTQFLLLTIAQIAVAIVLVGVAVYWIIRCYQLYKAHQKKH